jgi:hypothetical protein
MELPVQARFWKVSFTQKQNNFPSEEPPIRKVEAGLGIEPAHKSLQFQHPEIRQFLHRLPTMDVSDITPQLDRLEEELKKAEESLEPLLGDIGDISSKLPLLDKAKLYVLVAYAIEALLFCKTRSPLPSSQQKLTPGQRHYASTGWTQRTIPSSPN